MLEINRVSKIYPNGVHALDALTLAVAPGEIVVVVGGSGCGKSTLLRLASGLDAPSEGAVVCTRKPVVSLTSIATLPGVIIAFSSISS